MHRGTCPDTPDTPDTCPKGVSGPQRGLDSSIAPDIVKMMNRSWIVFFVAAACGGSAGGSGTTEVGATESVGTTGDPDASSGALPTTGASGGTTGGVTGTDGGTEATGEPDSDTGDAPALPGSVDCSILEGDDLHPLWLEYRADPDSHPRLPNISQVGYHYGDEDLPTLDGPIFDVTTYGAKGDGVTDDTAAIREALAAVGANGGVVYLPDGDYRVSGPLFVHTDRTVLRGQSRAGTRITFTRPLVSGHATNMSGDKSRWSWSGGLLWFSPASKNTYVPADSDLTGTWDEIWNVGEQVATVLGEQSRGDWTVRLSDASGLSVGQFVFLEIDTPPDISVQKHLTGDGPWADTYDWSPGNSSGVLDRTIDWPVEIAAITNNTLTLRQPLRFDLRAGWNARVMAIGDTIRDSGVESLTLVMLRDYDYSFNSHHLKEPGWNGPWFNNAIHCFARDVTIVDPDTGIGTSSSKNITLSGIRLEASADNRMTHHHGTTARELSQDILIEDFEVATKPWHGINVEGFSMGVVWSDGAMDHGTFDTHRGLPYEAVHTEISVYNDGKRGGAGNAGPIMGARFANWNVEVTNGVTDMVGDAHLMPSGALVGVRGCTITDPQGSECAIAESGPDGVAPKPANFYKAARALRLCPQR